MLKNRYPEQWKAYGLLKPRFPNWLGSTIAFITDINFLFFDKQDYAYDEVILSLKSKAKMQWIIGTVMTGVLISSIMMAN